MEWKKIWNDKNTPVFVNMPQQVHLITKKTAELLQK